MARQPLYKLTCLPDFTSRLNKFLAIRINWFIPYTSKKDYFKIIFKETFKSKTFKFEKKKETYSNVILQDASNYRLSI